VTIHTFEIHFNVTFQLHLGLPGDIKTNFEYSYFLYVFEPVNQAVYSNKSHGLNGASAGSQQKWTKLYGSKTMNNETTIVLAPDHTMTHFRTERLTD